VGILIFGVVCVMMTFVVPQIVGFLKSMQMELPFYTIALIATSDFFVQFWYLVIAIPVGTFLGLKVWYAKSRSFAFTVDKYAIRAPIIGQLIRKLNIARYTQTFASLFRSGVDVLRCLESSQQTMTNLALFDAMESVQVMVREGETLSNAFAFSGEFPTMVTRMLRIGEESGNVSHVLNQVSEFYTKDVDEEVQKLIIMIEPALTVVMGLIILWIAAGVFGPIYDNIGKLAM
jgi:type IV pilus assembly protein PilC